MLNPPFKLAGAEAAPSGVLARIYRPVECCDHPEHAAGAEPAWAPKARTRLADMDTHLHCSVLGTCLATADLRKLMRRFIDVQGATDVEVHHDAVSLASQGGLAAKALHKALDQRHDAVVQRFAKARDEQALTALWDEALHSGEIPGAYWAVLTHRDLTPDLRKKVFGDVHMLSHLVGAANRADIRRLVALERENTELRDRLERQQGRSQSLLEERDEALARVEAQRLQHDAADVPVQPASQLDELEAAAAQVGLHTERRERAEQAAALAHAELASLREATHTLNRQLDALTRELAAAETQLEQGADTPADHDVAHGPQLQGRRILYVGGRPASSVAIRDWVARRGGELQRHDGGLEDRKGLLASGVAWAELVVFPVDCVDHDSASNLKRLCTRQGVAFMPLRSAGVASFVAGLSDLTAASITPGTASNSTAR